MDADVSKLSREVAVKTFNIEASKSCSIEASKSCNIEASKTHNINDIEG